MEKILIALLCIGMAFACNNAGKADKNDVDSITPEITPPADRQGNTGMDTSTSLPSDTSSLTGSSGAHTAP